MIVIKKFTFNSFYENTYVVWDEETKESAVIDPGCYSDEENNVLADFIEKTGLKVKFLLITHSHIDHILGSRYIKEKYDPLFIVPELDMPLLSNVDKQAAAFGLEVDGISEPNGYMTEDKTLNIGESIISFLFTPGHTPGEFCIYMEKEEFCITGDVLFKNSIGRTDLWGGNYNMLMNSIKTRLLSLPDHTIIYPGHGDSSKIGIEKKENPFLLNLME